MIFCKCMNSNMKIEMMKKETSQSKFTVLAKQNNINDKDVNITTEKIVKNDDKMFTDKKEENYKKKKNDKEVISGNYEENDNEEKQFDDNEYENSMKNKDDLKRNLLIMKLHSILVDVENKISQQNKLSQAEEDEYNYSIKIRDFYLGDNGVSDIDPNDDIYD